MKGSTCRMSSLASIEIVSNRSGGGVVRATAFAGSCLNGNTSRASAAGKRNGDVPLDGGAGFGVAGGGGSATEPGRKGSAGRAKAAGETN